MSIANSNMTDRQFAYSHNLKLAMRSLGDVWLYLDSAVDYANVMEEVFLGRAYSTLESLKNDITVALREMGD